MYKFDSSHFENSGSIENICLANINIDKAFQKNEISLLELPEVANKKYGITQLEVFSSYFPVLDEQNWVLEQFKIECLKNSISELIITIDKSGDITNSDVLNRNLAVQKHFKWIKNASFINCKKVKIHIDNNECSDIKRNAIIDSLTVIADFAELFNIDIITESTDFEPKKTSWLFEIIKQVNKNNLLNYLNISKLKSSETQKAAIINPTYNYCNNFCETTNIKGLTTTNFYT